MADKRETIKNLGKSGALAKHEVTKRLEQLDRAEAEQRLTKPTNLGGGDGTKK